MPARIKPVHPALKHGCYSTTTLLPGEDPAAFNKLHQRLIADLTPNGPLEEDIVETIARRLWRKQNLRTFKTAKQVQDRWWAIYSAKLPSSGHVSYDLNHLLGQPKIDPAVEAAARKAADDQVRAEFGPEYAFVEMKELATVEQLSKDLAVEGQLDAMIERCLKRLLFLRGLKSISTSCAAVSRPLPRLAQKSSDGGRPPAPRTDLPAAGPGY